MRKRAAFLTIGQSPRPDILDEMRPWWKADLDVDEKGALDGLTREAIDALAPSNGEPRLVSRLLDGTEVVLSADQVHRRIENVAAACDEGGYDFLVLLCTGKFDSLQTRTLLLKAQPIVDHGVAAFASSNVGVLVPHAQQQEGIQELTTYASPYDDDRFEEAARELADADLIVMHCMGYTVEQKRRVAEVSGKPVLLAREMVATGVAWLLG